MSISSARASHKFDACSLCDHVTPCAGSIDHEIGRDRPPVVSSDQPSGHLNDGMCRGLSFEQHRVKTSVPLVARCDRHHTSWVQQLAGGKIAGINMESVCSMAQEVRAIGSLATSPGRPLRTRPVCPPPR
jgi:hypothetical protein